MLQPLLPLRPSVSLLEPDTLHARAGSCLLLLCLFNSSVVQVTVTWMLCIVQWSKRSSEEVGHDRSSTAWKTSEEKFKLAKTLSSSTSMLSSKQALSCLIMLLSDVGLMTIMRGTPEDNMGLTEESLPKGRESKESLLWLLSLSLPHGSCGISLVRLWLRPWARTNSGRVATVREVETSACSQPLSNSLMVDWCGKGLIRGKKKLICKHRHICIYTQKPLPTHTHKVFVTFCLVKVVISGWCFFLCDLLLYECLHDNAFLKELSAFLPKGSISISFNPYREKMQQFLMLFPDGITGQSKYLRLKHY